MGEMGSTALFDTAAGLLPLRLRTRTAALTGEEKARTEEIRLRVGQPLSLTTPEGEVPLWQTEVTVEDLEQVLDRATEFSRYTAARSMGQGYLTAPGGFRVGVCGRMVGEGQPGMEDISSLAIRIPRPCRGAAEGVLPELLELGRPVSTLILSPPGGGKTTLLRDLVRLFSEGTVLCPPMRVSLVDERGELAAMYRGVARMDVGPRTDVLTGCPKALAVPILLRAMGPQIIALDEVALNADVEAVRLAAGCGAVLLATVHAPSVQDLMLRQLGRQLLECGVFRRAVVISGRGKDRRCAVEELI